MKKARIQEIFASIQGEGPWVGQRHIFVRFLGCDIRCRYCDTPTAAQWESGVVDPKTCGVQRTACSNKREQTPNSVSPAALTEFCKRLVIPGPSRPVISLTGGEPLLQALFLENWLPSVRKDFTLYLETSGIHPDAMERIVTLVDVVSIDFKLPSATGLRPYWEEHRRFLSASRGAAQFVKVVVTRDTCADDILTAARIIADSAPSLVLVLQPAGGSFAPESGVLIEFQETALRIIKDVRVIPQIHKILNVP